MELVAIQIGMLYFGNLIDKYLGWPGYAVLVGTILGFGSWLSHLIFAINRLKQDGDHSP